MWAVIDKKTQIVVGSILPTASLEEVKRIEKTFDVVRMTLDNSPATIGDTYKNGKFISVQHVKE